MRYAFNYAVKVAVATADGNLGQLRYGCNEVVLVCNVARNYDGQQYVLNLELADGDTLIGVPEGAVRWEGSVPGVYKPGEVVLI